MGYRLGLDVGPTSIGWGIVDEATQRVRDAGVRVFPEGVARDKQGGEVSKNAARRLARQARRQLQRKKTRREQIKAVLAIAGMWPREEVRNSIDPYRIRARAIRMQVPLEVLGVALFHLGRRRGFKSSRKGDSSASTRDKSIVFDGISELERGMNDAGTKYLGEYLCLLRERAGKDNEHLVRLRGRYTLRAMHEQEFDAIWRAQQAFYPETLTEERREHLRTTIFYQRPLRPSDELVGFCDLEPKQRRCPMAHRAAQRFRIVQEVSNLRRIDSLGVEHVLSEQQRSKIIALLLSKEKATFDQIRQTAGLRDEDRFNLENGKRAYLWGHRTDHAMRHKDHFGKGWDALEESRKDEIVVRLIREDDPTLLVSVAMTEWGLSRESANALCAISLVKGYMGFSLAAIRRLLPHMEKGIPLRVRDASQSALALAGYLGPEQRALRVLDRLDHPPEDIRNPIVLAAMHQVRRLVNAIIKEYGKPASIHIELAREAQGSIAERSERTIENAKRRSQNEKIRERLRTEFQIADPSRDDVERYKLWIDMNEKCPYTGKTISCAQLFTSEIQVDHILPYRRSLDNSYANKTVCFRSANVDKGDRTPHEWLSGDEKRYEAMLQTVRRLWGIGQGGKARKFALQTCVLDDFIERQLNDTKYITRQLASYLRRLGTDVVCVRGQTTAELRWRWGLDTVLRDDGLRAKNRDDHRHHAVDAVVIAQTDRSRLQALSRIEKGDRRGTSKLTRREVAAVIDKKTGDVVSDIQPWQGFRDQLDRIVKAINVSHRPHRRISGELHAANYYGPTDTPGESVIRVPLVGISIDDVMNIRDKGVKRAVTQRLAQHGIDVFALATGGPKSRGSKLKNGKKDWDDAVKAAFAVPLMMPTRRADSDRAPEIRTVRVIRSDKTIRPLGKTSAWVKPGSNHHVAIFELPPDSKGRVERIADWAARIDVAERVARREPIVRRRHPKHPDARLFMVLSPGDLVLADFGKGGGERLYRFKTGASTQGQLYFVDARDARKDSELELFVARPGTLGKYKVRRVTVDLLGKIRDADSGVHGPNTIDPRAAVIAKEAILAGLTNTQAHKRLKRAGLGNLGGHLTAALKASRLR